jgi:FkbM family methyltransferase
MLRGAKRHMRQLRGSLVRQQEMVPQGSPPSTMPPVVLALLREIVSADAGPELLGNVDPMRFPAGFEEPPREDAPARLAELLRHAGGLGLLFDRLERRADRELLIRVLAFRVLGHRRVQLPMTLNRLEGRIARAHAVRTEEKTAPLGFLGWYADDYDLGELGYSIRLRGFVGAVVQTFDLEQYRSTGPPEVAARPGDIVIDGGGYWGDTALYFAQIVGPAGRVVSFEFEPSNLEALHYNLSLNPQLAHRVHVVSSALWDQVGEEVNVHHFGPGTSIRSDGEARASTDTIDALVARGDVERVDFIKLDIEGAELRALRGAEATLLRFRPRLAVAAYHKPDDLAAIPEYLASLEIGYRFQLGHVTMHGEETVLFAIADRAPVGLPGEQLDSFSEQSAV